jgi:hypothetical protein
MRGKRQLELSDALGPLPESLTPEKPHYLEHRHRLQERLLMPAPKTCPITKSSKSCWRRATREVTPNRSPSGCSTISAASPRC